MRKGILAAITLLIVTLGWYFGSPRWTLWRMQAAAQAHDAKTLSAYVDYPAVRESAKSQLRAQLAIRAAEDKNPFAALGLAMALRMIDPMIDAMLTPEMLEAMFARERTDDRKKPFGAQVEDTKLVRDGFDEFRLVPVKVDKGKTGFAILFTRHGLGWKLSGFRAPVALPPTAGGS